MCPVTVSFIQLQYMVANTPRHHTQESDVEGPAVGHVGLIFHKQNVKRINTTTIILVLFDGYIRYHTNIPILWYIINLQNNIKQKN